MLKLSKKLIFIIIGVIMSIDGIDINILRRELLSNDYFKVDKHMLGGHIPMEIIIINQI